MSLNTSHLKKCLLSLSKAFESLQKQQPKSIDYDIFRNATIKGFELSLETSGKLLIKAN